MNQYQNFLTETLTKGAHKPDRTGTGTLSTFGLRMEFDLAEGFPLLTTKKVHFKSVVAELLWFLSGSTNTKDLDSTIWDEWADKDGDLGPIYGSQWRTWGGRGLDQIEALVQSLSNSPDSRRHIVSAWNVADIPEMALPPCHIMFQCYVHPDGRLDLQVYQRSADAFLGVPFNIASYALLTHLLAAQTGLTPGRLIWVGGDCHIYDNHRAQVATQLARGSRPLPTLQLAHAGSLFEYGPQHIHLEGYNPHPAIAGEVAV